MKKENLFLSILKVYFPGSKKFCRSELRDFYRKQEAGLADQVFRRKLYALQKKRIIRQTDRGMYCLDEAIYTAYLVWETKILHEFMLHQPGQSQIILEVEKEASESVFNFLASHHPGKVF